jgi:cell division inhibitor SulA
MKQPFRRFLNRLALVNVSIVAIAMMGPTEAVEPLIIAFHIGSFVWVVAWLKGRRYSAI